MSSEHGAAASTCAATDPSVSRRTASSPWWPTASSSARRRYWVLDAAGWSVIGLNAQLLGTDTEEEAAQWSWLAAALAGSAGRPTLLCLHKPLFQDSPDDGRPHQRYVPAAARRRLVGLLSAVRLRAVVSGHVHQYLDRVVAGVRHLWLPSTAFVLPDGLQERIGEKLTGIGMIELARGDLRVQLACPEGVTCHSALDHPVYPKHVEARARLRAGLPLVPNT